MTAPMTPPTIPLATYRLQFNRNFTFADATRIIPYLATLGISHCYASPYLRARPGSTHGYDIVDHNQLNPEIGTPEEFDQFVETLHRHGMGQILDIVPNHMGVMGADNSWWLDVLENGEASIYGDYFDIDWQPIKDELQGKVLLPILDDQYGIVLDRGDLKLAFGAEKGEFSIYFHQHRFPVDPKQYPLILARKIEELRARLGADNPQLLELQSVTSAFGHLPDRSDTAEERRAERNRDKEIHKRRLASLCTQSADVLEFVLRNVVELNGAAGNTRSFDELHEIIKTQSYRLAYWRVAVDDINYRRFFDINDLAGLRMENQRVFDATHQFIGELLGSGKVNGLRIDHPDGLFDPEQYFERLQTLRPGYVVVEKILSGDESLPSGWPVQGTTGYEFSNLVNGLFVDAAAGAKIKTGYRGFLGATVEVRDVLYRCKKVVMKQQLASDLNVLANYLSRIALANRHTCDFTLNSLRRALSDIVANFPVYRTYVTDDVMSDSDRWYIESAIQAAKRQSRSQDTSVFDFIHHILLARNGDTSHANRNLIAFSMKLQQFTSPVMAKGLEDTSFYRYHPLMSRNDVGADPLEFGVRVEEFHRKVKNRSRQWPHAMLATSTHDSKLSEDVRTRIDVLSEIPGQWRLKARQWRLLNRSKKTMLDGVESPSRNDEYLFYQVLLGVWPLGETLASDQLRDRLKTYVLKAAREAKESTSWAHQNTEYENALTTFVEAALDPVRSQEFLSDFVQLQRWVAAIGTLNSLSRTLIKFTTPGVPDTYQGNELLDFSLVDPDNRRPVDYSQREKLLAEVSSIPANKQGCFLRELTKDPNNPTDLQGRAKLWLTWKLLQARNRFADLFQRGEYIPLAVNGPRAQGIVAFGRRYENEFAVVVAPRLWGQVIAGRTDIADPEIWRETFIEIPADWPTDGYRDWITNEALNASTNDGKPCFDLQYSEGGVPWALLLRPASSAMAALD
jgi:(1->4)-alpha-D-glucan 1-alpha-D-glucosylmutase